MRKSELTKATWEEVDFDQGVWTIPEERMKARKPHNVYFVAAADGRRLQVRYDADVHIAASALNRVTQQIAERAHAEGLELAHFSVHDLRRTGSTILNEVGFNGDWIEKALAHEKSDLSRGTYNKAQYADVAAAVDESDYDAGAVLRGLRFRLQTSGEGERVMRASSRPADGPPLIDGPHPSRRRRTWRSSKSAAEIRRSAPCRRWWYRPRARFAEAECGEWFAESP